MDNRKILLSQIVLRKIFFNTDAETFCRFLEINEQNKLDKIRCSDRARKEIKRYMKEGWPFF